MSTTSKKQKKSTKIYIWVILTFLGFATFGIAIYYYFNIKYSRLAYERAFEAMKNRDFYNASDYCYLSLHYDDTNGNAYLLLAKINQELGFYDEMLKYVIQALDNTKRPDGGLYYIKGRANYGLGNVEEAMIDFEKARKIPPYIDSTDLFLGRIKFSKKDFKGSLENYNSFLKKKRSYIAYRERGDCFYQLQNYKEALIDFDKVATLNPSLGEVHYNKAMCNFILGDTVAACMDCGSAINNGYEPANELAEKNCFKTQQ